VSEPLLRVAGVGKRFGGLLALSDVTLELHPGEALGLIGPNGAGKSTLVNCLTGTLKPDTGVVHFDGHNITRWPTHRRVRAGLARTFQHPRGFGEQTVLDNVAIAGMWRDSLNQARERALPIAEEVGLDEFAHLPARQLSLSNRRRLEVARALATGARVVLLDEAMAGLAEAEIGEMSELLRGLVQRGIGILLVEHLVHVVTAISTRVLVLDGGRPLATGAPKDVLSNPVVVEAYLGQAIA